MMKLYNKKKAVPFILRRVYLEEYITLTKPMLEALISQCIDADFDYMLSESIFMPDGSPGKNYYNVKNARHHILDTLIGGRPLTEEELDDYFKLVGDYQDFNLSYLEANGLWYPVDER